MDAFYASVEQRDRPELRGQPVLVGGDPNGRGVVAAASYEARRFGCRSAMPTAQAIRRCPHAVVLPVRMECYAEVSRQVFAIFEQFTPLVEPLSIDEAFLDVTGSDRLFGSSETIARRIKQRIREQTQLTGSAGVAPNKFLAKLASDLDKPDGLVVVPADGVQPFLDPLSISRLWGAGGRTVERFERMGVQTFADGRRLSEQQLRNAFGEAGGHFYRLLRGRDDRPITTDREAKSISHELTFATDVADHDHLRGVLLDQADQVARRLRRHGRLARTVMIKVRSADFRTITRRTTLAAPTDRTDEIWQAAATLFDAWRRTQPPPVRLIGMGVTELTAPEGQQLMLFEPSHDERRRRRDSVVDAIREKFGTDAIARGGSIRRHKEE